MHHTHLWRSAWPALILLGFYGPLALWCFVMAFRRGRR